jgi:hypothetical protein
VDSHEHGVQEVGGAIAVPLDRPDTGLVHPLSVHPGALDPVASVIGPIHPDGLWKHVSPLEHPPPLLVLLLVVLVELLVVLVELLELLELVVVDPPVPELVLLLVEVAPPVPEVVVLLDVAPPVPELVLVELLGMPPVGWSL